MIRKMRNEDREIFYKMAKMFYASDAVLFTIPQNQHIVTFNEIMRSDVYLEGYIFELGEEPVGYAITAKMFSQEAGGITLWIDEVYIMNEYRSKGLGKEFFNYIQSTLDTSIVRLRLEVETDNERAKKLYQNMGFEMLEYQQMFKDTTELS